MGGIAHPTADIMVQIIRPYAPSDATAVQAMLLPVFRAGDTYSIDTDISANDALAYWTGPGRQVFMAVAERVAVGTYYITRNQGGGGAHVCNCGFVTDPAARGHGVARAMLHHALGVARDRGFRAMQFNFVVSTNTRAIAIWQGAGFDIVGRLPGAFRHPDHGYVDALVMYRDLAAE